MAKKRQNTENIPELELINKADNKTFNYKTYHKPYFERSWHYHPEYELLLITNGYGKRFVGDHSEDFKVGDLVFIAPFLPHAWISDSKFLDPDCTDMCSSAYIQFNGQVFNSMFFDLPEFKGVKKIAEKAQRGLKLIGHTREKVKEILLSFNNLSDFERAIQLLNALNLIYEGKYEVLSSQKFLSDQIVYKSQRIRTVVQYVMRNLNKDITVEQCAQLTKMTKSSFCRYFKTQTHMTFTHYLKTVRIDFAKRLLLNTSMPIKEVGYNCGFESISYFNQVFKDITGKSPGKVRKNN